MGVMIAKFPESEIPSPFVDGLTEELLVEVVLRGEARRNDATPLDAPARAGLDCHHEKVRAIREELVPNSWTIDNEKNYCRVVSPCGLHAIAIASGTRGTGDLDANPETARPMGEATRTVVAMNRAQGSFSFVEEPRSLSDRLTWLLLTYRDGDVCKAELSLPDAIAEDGTVCRWKQRYILDMPDLEPPMVRSDDDDGAPDAPIEIDVAFK